MKIYDVEVLQKDGGYNKMTLETDDIANIIGYLKEDTRVVEIVSIFLRE